MGASVGSPGRELYKAETDERTAEVQNLSHLSKHMTDDIMPGDLWPPSLQLQEPVQIS